MRPDQIAVILGGILAIAAIVWFFWLKPVRGTRTSAGPDGYQEAMVLVKGGYTPDAILAEAGRPIRLLFRREDTSSCSEMVVFGDFGKSALLPLGKTVPVELPPAKPGTYGFQCQMGMLRGKLVVE